ncbi:MarR family transcriptional regulator [Hyphomicrobium sp.]|uniref:MarR family winged helix-turn-helix transcriptional regulator n=1 Tax=Hyphomicrobium sp. TaxID=82 RepID=UPI000FB64C9E|nr:MarR family transcriptional regulator [Hyphomicrobium sp.]RUO99480.1 MAG: MarR family transcriptional regulator [Hyphomicrobium sp.]
MADITSESPSEKLAASGRPPHAADDDRRSTSDLLACIELFYFAYRGFTCEADSILEQYGFGRAHHRVLHFVNRNPGLKVAELLDILRITKQSLARVLKQLVDEGFIIQKAGHEDRRERRLYLSAKGARLTDKLTQIQAKRIEGALAGLGSGADAMTRNFLFAMVAEKDKPRVEALLRSQRGGSPIEESEDCNL